MRRIVTLASIVVILFSASICYAIDLEGPSIKKVTVKSEMERESSAIFEAVLESHDISERIKKIDLVFQKNKQQNTDSPGFLLGAYFKAWALLGDVTTLNSAQYGLVMIYFKNFRKLSKEEEQESLFWGSVNTVNTVYP